MAKVTVKPTKSSKFNIILIVVVIAFFVIYIGIDKIKNGSGNGSILSKKEHLRTVDDWKKIADYRAQEFYECTKDLDMDISKWYLYESCATDYNNSWVRFRDGLDGRANLNFEQIESLKNYWDKTREEIEKKVSDVMDENERQKRPNR
ncbi:MAG: hypothetical protein POELPBGB_00920 [Bacteroidia bacterium]|nr:hypothetical protein [Bacteroidia bacterium]